MTTAATARTGGVRSPEPRIGLVGCGASGNAHLDRLLAQSADIVAVCDPDADALAAVASRLPRRPRLFRSEQDLLAAGAVDALVLCTPFPLHARQVRAALDAGVHVLCEEPFAPGLAAAQELAAEARQKGLGLFVSHALRNPGYTLFLLAAAGRIGPLRYVAITRAQHWREEHRGTWRLRSADTGGGYLQDAGFCVLDLLLRLVDSPVVQADAVLERCGQEVDVRASLRIGFKSGARADVTLLGDSAENLERIQLFGERGTAGWWAHEDAAPELYLRPLGGPVAHGDPAAHGISPDAAFLTALRSGRSFGPDTAPDLYDAASALPTVSLVERVYQNAAWK